MQIIQGTAVLKQGTVAWFAARRGRLTGSNVGAALGLNPWKTPDDLIRSMVREHHAADSEFTGNIATEHGSLHEPLALMEYLGKTGNHVDECGFYSHPEHTWLGASPDGLIDDDGLIEIKCPFSMRNKTGEALVFKTAAEQPHYYAQMQMEMACTGRTWCDFYQWAPAGDSLERVEFSQEWWDKYLPSLKSFYAWFLSEIDNPAHLEEKQKEINTFHVQALLLEYDQASAAIDDATARKKEILAELVQLSKERNAILHGRKLTKVERVGNVDYKKIPELQGVELDQYRGKPSQYWRLS